MQKLFESVPGMENARMMLGGTTFINLCPHDVVLTDGSGIRIVFKASGQVARVESSASRESLDMEVAPNLMFSLPIQQVSENFVVGLPEPEEGTIYITSYIVAKFVRRMDVLAPLTDASAVRDNDNKVTSVRTFQRFI